MKNKKFDAVKMMRSIRNSLSTRYILNPKLEEKELREIRLKYKIGNPISKTIFK